MTEYKEAIISEPGFVLLERGEKPEKPKRNEYGSLTWIMVWTGYEKKLAAWESAGRPVAIAPELLEIKEGAWVWCFELGVWGEVKKQDLYFENVFLVYFPWKDDAENDNGMWYRSPETLTKYPPGAPVLVKIENGIITDIKLK